MISFMVSEHVEYDTDTATHRRRSLRRRQDREAAPARRSHSGRVNLVSITVGLAELGQEVAQLHA